MSRTRTVAAPLQSVWEVLADFGALSSWAGNVDHSCLLEHGAGTTLLGASRRVQVGRNALVERIVDCVAPTTLAYDIEGLPRRLGRVNNRWTLAAAGTGTTAVTLASTVDIGAKPLARVAERAICRMMARQSDALLAGLAERVERSHD